MSKPNDNRMPLSGRRIVLGVGGGIAAYKSPDLVRRLREAGAEVRVVMTRGGTEFVAPLTFQAVSGNPVHTRLLDEGAEAGMGHIELARWADLIIIAPATADLMARMAAGMADDLLSTVYLASEAPVLLAPAMNRVMWSHPATHRNQQELADRGVRFVGPEAGDQACGELGVGRMSEPTAVVEAAVEMVLRGGQLSGIRVLLTAGPTYEDLDPVRFLGNRSSGKMGFALAEAFVAQGAHVVLVAGPVKLPTPRGCDRVDVRSAGEMHDAVVDRVGFSDIFVSCAAVADFRPEQRVERKIKKETAATLELRLVRNPDILAEVASRGDAPFTVGFAAETGDVESLALGKMKDKKVDMIAANEVGGCETAFDADDNALIVLWPGGRKALPRSDKAHIARQLVALIAQQYGDKHIHGT